MESFKSLFSKKRILITFGTGGVGKTSVSTAIAAKAAIAGKKTIVVTIDPAKRLATALGLNTMTEEPTSLTDDLKQVCSSRNITFNNGELFALMPDARQTFANLVDTLAPSNDIAEKVKKNPIYQILATEFSGANEYMALQKLNEIDKLNEYDLIVLDTPPSRNALSFIHAPKLVSEFFDERFMRWLVLPANKILAEGMKKAFHILEKLTGAGFLNHMFELASLGSIVQDEFVKDVKRVNETLGSADVGYVLVSAPTPETISETKHLAGELKSLGRQLDAVILNRTLSYLTIEENQIGSSPGLTVLKTIQMREARVEKELFSDVYGEEQKPISKRLPELSRDIRSLEDLVYISSALDS